MSTVGHVERWAALGCLEAEQRFRKIQGCRDAWILAQALGRTEHQVDRQSKAAATGKPSTKNGTSPRLLGIRRGQTNVIAIPAEYHL